MPTTSPPYSFGTHPAHELELASWPERHLARVPATGALSPAERDAVRDALVTAYARAGLPTPGRVIFVESAMTAMVAGCIASGARWLRTHGTDLFSRPLRDAEIHDGIVAACRFAVSFAIGRWDGDPASESARLRIARLWRTTTAAALEAATDATEAPPSFFDDDAPRTGAERAADPDPVIPTYNTAGGEHVECCAAQDFVSLNTAVRATTVAGVANEIYAATVEDTERAIEEVTDSEAYQAVADTVRRQRWSGMMRALDEVSDELTGTLGSIADVAKPATVGAVAYVLLRCLMRWSAYHHGGHECAWLAATANFFRDVAQPAIDWSAWQHGTELFRHGPMCLHRDFAIVADRPHSLHTDDRSFPHRPDGPAVTWSDGWEISFWRGTHIPTRWLRDRDAAAAVASDWSPAWWEQRAACEIADFARTLRAMPHRQIDSFSGRLEGTLIAVDLPRARDARFMLVRTAACPEFAIRVDPKYARARRALAGVFGDNCTEYFDHPYQRRC